MITIKAGKSDDQSRNDQYYQVIDYYQFADWLSLSLSEDVEVVIVINSDLTGFHQIKSCFLTFSEFFILHDFLILTNVLQVCTQ